MIKPGKDIRGKKILKFFINRKSPIFGALHRFTPLEGRFWGKNFLKKSLEVKKKALPLHPLPRNGAQNKIIEKVEGKYKQVPRKENESVDFFDRKRDAGF